MPWYNGDYPPSYKNRPKHIRDKPTQYFPYGIGIDKIIGRNVIMSFT